MSDSVWPHRWQPTRLPHPWDSPGKNTGVGCHFLLQCIKVKIDAEKAFDKIQHPFVAGVQPQQSPRIPSGWTALANERMTRGDQASVSEACNYFQKKLLYPDLYMEENERYGVMQSQLKYSSSFALIETRIFFAYLSHKQGSYIVYIIFWPWRPVDILWPFFDKGWSTRKLIFPWSVFSLYL